MEDFKNEIRDITEKQKALLKQVERYNKDKIEILNKNYESDDKIFNRFLDIKNRYNIVYENSIRKTGKDIEEIYRKVCKKIFTKSLETERKFDKSERDTYGYWSTSKEDKVCFTRNGMAYRPQHRDRLRCLDDFPFIVETLKADIQLRNLMLSKRKLEIWQKLYDIIINYKKRELELREIFTLEKNIKVTGENDEKITKDDFLDNKIIYGYLKDIEINKIEINITDYRQKIEFYSHNGEENQFTLNMDRNSDDERTHKIKYFINLLPESLLDKLEKHLKGLESAIENNQELYNKIKESIGYVLLSDEI
jgi:hypothetical protein